MTTIIDYSTGNLRSVENALRRIGEQFAVTADPALIMSAERVLLPGVGEASSAMHALKNTGLTEVIRELKCPVLGICIGMQLMCASSEEGMTDCLGIFNTRVVKLAGGGGLKIPHMGWNTIKELSGPLLEGIEENSYIYYVHSFAPELGEDTAAVTEYGRPFSAVLQKDNFFGTQFHPEKSGILGEKILKNFTSL